MFLHRNSPMLLDICDHTFMLLSDISRIIHLGNRMANCTMHVLNSNKISKFGLLLSLTAKNVKVKRRYDEVSMTFDSRSMEFSIILMKLLFLS
jgi:hypothetical protein